MTAGHASPYGSTYRRAAAAGIDGAIIGVLQVALVFGVPAAARALDLPAWEMPQGLTMLEEIGLSLLVSAAIGIVYRTLYDASPWQATPGRRALSLKVCTVDGGRLGAAQAFVRALVREVGMLGLSLGALPFLWTRRRQAAHDLAAGSVVVLERVAPAVTAAAAPESGVPRGGWMLILHVATLVPTAIGLWFAMPTLERWMAMQQVEVARMQAGPLQDEVIERYDEGESLDEIHSDPQRADPGKADELDKGDVPAEEVPQEQPPVLPAWLDAPTHSATLSGGAVVITFLPGAAAQLRGKHLVLMPAVDAEGAIAWVCGRAAPPRGHVPHRADYANLTDVDDELLPRDCRLDAD